MTLLRHVLPWLLCALLLLWPTCQGLLLLGLLTAAGPVTAASCLLLWLHLLEDSLNLVIVLVSIRQQDSSRAAQGHLDTSGGLFEQ